MMWWYGPGMNGWGFVLLSVGSVLFWIMIIFGLITLARVLRTGGRAEQARPTPEELLAERFARGEIDEQEYRQSLDTLRSAAPGRADPVTRTRSR